MIKRKEKFLICLGKSKQNNQAMTFSLDQRMIEYIPSLSISALHVMVVFVARWFEKRVDSKNDILIYSRYNIINYAFVYVFRRHNIMFLIKLSIH
jgi:hypothetical protein